MTETNDDEPSTETDLFALLSDVGEGWLFRGQGDYDWKLTTRLERELLRWQMAPDEKDRLAAEAEAINTFVAKARHLRPNLQEDDLLGWLSVVQHYGAPTRLLDWTRSPYVACYSRTPESKIGTRRSGCSARKRADSSMAIPISTKVPETGPIGTRSISGTSRSQRRAGRDKQT